MKQLDNSAKFKKYEVLFYALRGLIQYCKPFFIFYFYFFRIIIMFAYFY